MWIASFTTKSAIAVVLFLVLCAISHNRVNARSVHIALHASWNATSPAAETVKHVYDIWGPTAAVKFMRQFADLLDEDDRFSTDEFTAVTEKTERQLIFDAFAASQSHPLVLPTLRWTLSARVHSPYVQFQYSLASRALSLFPRDSVKSPLSTFAVLTSASRDSATLLLRPDEITSSANSLVTVRYPPPELAPRTGDHIPMSACIASGSDTVPKPLIVLYAHLPHPSFPKWIRAVSSLIETCSHQVVLRFAPPVVPYPAPRSYTPLSGYAASVTLRSTEYNVVDDRMFSTRLFEDCPPGLSSSDCAARHSNDDTDTPFAWTEPTPNPKNASLFHATASKFVLARASGGVDRLLERLAMVAEDAPAVLRSSEYLTGDHVGKASDKQFENDVRAIRSAVGDEDLIMLNGFKVDLSAIRQGASKLLRCLTAFSSAASVFASNSDENTVIPLPVERPESPPRLRVLLPVEEKAPNALVWFNDMFNDGRYSKWPALNLSDKESIENFVSKVEKQRLRSVPDTGQHLKLVKTRAHHLQMLLVVDPGDSEHLPFLTVPESVVKADLPIRVGVVLVPNGKTSEIAAAVFYHFLRLKGRRVAAQYVGMLRQVIDYVTSATDATGLTDMMVDMAFQQIAPRVGSPYKSATHVYKEDEDVKRDLEEGKSFAQAMRLYTDGEPSTDSDGSETKQVSFLCLLNGIPIKDIGREIISFAVREQERVASLLSNGIFGEEKVDELSVRWVKGDDSIIVVNRLSRDMRSGGTPRSGNLPKKVDVAPVLAKDIAAREGDLKNVKYFSNDAGDDFNVTVWLAGTDRDSDSFLKKRELMKQLSESEFSKQVGIRVAILPDATELHDVVLARATESTGDDSLLVINGRRTFASAVEDVDDLIVEIASDFEKVNIPSNLHGDVRLLYNLYEKEIVEACMPERRGGDKISAEELIRAVKENAQTISLPKGFSELDVRDNPPPLSALAVIDPISPNAYVTVSVLQALRSAFSKNDLFMGLVVAPALGTMKKKLEPPNTFYKFLLRPDDLAVDENDGARFGSRLSFDRLPQRNVLTVAVEPPRAWFVSSFMTNYDMDNVILDNVSQNLDLFTEYQLVNLIVEGSCIDEAGRPPQGLKLLLANEDGVTVDTIVMANLGYFQLKVPSPGIWWLSLARGASSKIFVLRSMEMFKDSVRTSFDADTNGRVAVPVESLSGAGGILLRVIRRPGMEGKSLLDPESANMTKEENNKTAAASHVVHKIKSTVRNLFGRKTPLGDEESLARGQKGNDDTINVFSVASGHLYERFLKIMISSVTKNASRKVKFWLLENYLSPAFKKLLPEFAKEHGAEVGMVTYRWPGWLRAQKEKQRIIWAYKILFLDVLFPLDVGRIIFVDSDQVIRGDVAELMDIDLKGAPYGYVPFCDSREEVEGYRFWKTGFWKDTLQGANYRISALYVVDLNRFRETAAGDTLRFIYQSLSADPNSLSNLDQDLPNYASVASVTGTTVPIFDLPEEWLWCESWCDDESKTRAKAIDLCNNPMTKEPKLDSAKRIISEWVDLDRRASELTEVIYKRLLTPEQSVREDAEDEAKTEL